MFINEVTSYDIFLTSIHVLLHVTKVSKLLQISMELFCLVFQDLSGARPGVVDIWPIKTKYVL